VYIWVKFHFGVVSYVSALIFRFWPDTPTTMPWV
jgi:hypothetical protein